MSTARIRELNDLFRTSLGTNTLAGNNVISLTPAVADLGETAGAALMLAVAGFDKWAEGNDPYNEHDFGKILHDGETYFWKIDYYAPGLAAGAEDPADPARTVMHSDEY